MVLFYRNRTCTHTACFYIWKVTIPADKMSLLLKNVVYNSKRYLLCLKWKFRSFSLLLKSKTRIYNEKNWKKKNGYSNTGNTVVLNAYAPPQEKYDDTKGHLILETTEVIDQIPKHNMKISRGNFSTNQGRNFQNQQQRMSVHMIWNNNKVRVV